MWSLKLSGKNKQLSGSGPGPRVLTGLSQVARKHELGADLLSCVSSPQREDCDPGQAWKCVERKPPGAWIKSVLLLWANHADCTKEGKNE